MAQLQGETVRQWTAEAQDIELRAERAAEIAAAISPIAAAARRAAGALRFDSEPADFVRAQRRWAGPRQ